MSVRSRSKNLRSDETGAVMVLSALVMVVLFAFAALAVDLGAGWAQKRTNQSAVDAAVMAGALEYLTDTSPSSAVVVDVVRDYVSRNVDLTPTSGDWLTCLDPAGVADGFTGLVDSGGFTMNCISIKQGATGGDETLLRVRLPDRLVKTSFASVIGWDTINVSAVAVAEILLDSQAPTLPVALPSNFGSEECLGTPPSGHTRDRVICQGPDSGNFGLLDSPFFEDHPSGNGCGNNPVASFSTRSPFALAVGIDHAIQPWPDALTPITPGDLSPEPSIGGDSCDADTTPPAIPYILNTQTGNVLTELNAGLIGPGPFGDDGEPGRLRQSGGAAPYLWFQHDNSGNDFSLDNTGLWEYLDTPKGTPDGRCLATHYGTAPAIGRQATEDIVSCLDAHRGDDDDHPEFNEALIASPRFALVPVLSYLKGEFGGNEWRGIEELVPVYLNASWYRCGTPNRDCWFFPEDFPDDEASNRFNPGEGTRSPSMNESTTLDTPRTIQLDGIAALVLDWEWLYPEAKNELGEVAPLSVSLYE